MFVSKPFIEYITFKLEAIPKYPSIATEDIFHQRSQELDKSAYAITQAICGLEMYLSLIEIRGIEFSRSHVILLVGDTIVQSPHGLGGPKPDYMTWFQS